MEEVRKIFLAICVYFCQEEKEKTDQLGNLAETDLRYLKKFIEEGREVNKTLKEVNVIDEKKYRDNETILIDNQSKVINELEK